MGFGRVKMHLIYNQESEIQKLGTNPKTDWHMSHLDTNASASSDNTGEQA